MSVVVSIGFAKKWCERLGIDWNYYVKNCSDDVKIVVDCDNECGFTLVILNQCNPEALS